MYVYNCTTHLFFAGFSRWRYRVDVTIAGVTDDVTKRLARHDNMVIRLGSRENKMHDNGRILE